MILYGIVILLCMAAIAGGNVLWGVPAFGFSWYYPVVATVFLTVAVIAQDGLFAFLLRRLPQKWFWHERKFFVVSLREKRAYERLGIKKWKDKIPELGGFTNFSKGKVTQPHNNEYVCRFLLEIDYGQIIHLVTAFTGYLIVFLCPLRYALALGAPVATVNAVLNVLPLLTLRYNGYKLNVLYRRNKLRETQSSNPQSDDPARREA